MKIIKSILIYNNIEIDDLQIIENGIYILLFNFYNNKIFILNDNFFKEQKIKKISNNLI